MADKKTAPDWDKAEPHYRAGIMSLRAVAALAGASAPALLKHAEKHGWQRDLTAKVKQAVNTELVNRPVNTAEEKRSEKEKIEQAAAAVVAVARDHRGILGRGRLMVGELLGELEQATQNREEIAETILEETAGDKNNKRRQMMLAAVELPTRAVVMDKLASALNKLVTAEREAWGMNDKDSDKDELDSLTEEQLLARLHALEARYKEVMG